jgi:heat shock protein 5
MGSRITPSIVSFAQDRKLVGEGAQAQVTLNPENTIFAIKRLMGLRYSDSELANELPRLPYKIVSVDDHPYVEVEYKGKVMRFAPEEISAQILRYEKETAEKFLGFPVTNAVITVPAYFNDGRRKATIDAGKLAGLNVLQILNEPTAACIAYGFEKDNPNRQTFLVYDLGGGTFDVSIAIVDHDRYEVQAVSGDPHLGGEDFDRRLQLYLKDLFKKEHGVDLSRDSKAMAKLRRAATQAKIALSLGTETEIEIESLYRDLDFSATVTRARFEDLCVVMMLPNSWNQYLMITICVLQFIDIRHRSSEFSRTRTGSSIVPICST